MGVGDGLGLVVELVVGMMEAVGVVVGVMEAVEVAWAVGGPRTSPGLK